MSRGRPPPRYLLYYIILYIIIIYHYITLHYISLSHIISLLSYQITSPLLPAARVGDVARGVAPANPEVGRHVGLLLYVVDGNLEQIF